MSSCQTCHRPVLWTRTAAGTMPVDTVPHPDGDVALVPMMQSPPMAVVLSGDRLTEGRRTQQLHRDHRTTCAGPPDDGSRP